MESLICGSWEKRDPETEDSKYNLHGTDKSDLFLVQQDIRELGKI